MPTFELKLNTVGGKVILIFLSLLLVMIVGIGLRIALPEQITLFAGSRPTNLGVSSSQLVPCPSTPNCVNSQSQDAEHSIEPLTFQSTPAQAFANLKRVIQSFDQSKIITETEEYLYTEFTIPLVGFIDDVEFYLDRDTNLIQVRSASRLGESDLGVNRKRVETIRAKFNQLNQA